MISDSEFYVLTFLHCAQPFVVLDSCVILDINYNTLGGYSVYMSSFNKILIVLKRVITFSCSAQLSILIRHTMLLEDR